VKSQAEHPAWTETGSTIATSFYLNGPLVSESYPAPTTISSNAFWTPTYLGTRRIDAARNASWRCTLNVSSAGTPSGNILAVGGALGEGAMGIGFDSSGNLIWRVGQGQELWYHRDQTSWTHYWPLRESSGNRNDLIGSTTLTESGTVGEGARQYGAKLTAGVTTSLFDSGTPSFLTGTDISIAGND